MNNTKNPVLTGFLILSASPELSDQIFGFGTVCKRFLPECPGSFECSVASVMALFNHHPPAEARFGQGLHSNTEAFLEAQDTDPLMELTADWLWVGHVYEIVSFAPPRGADMKQYAIVADPEVCWALLLWADSEDPDTNNHYDQIVAHSKYVYYLVCNEDLRDFNLETYVMSEDHLPSIRRDLHLASPEAVTVGTSGNGELKKAGAFIARFPDFPTSAQKRYYLIEFTGSTQYKVYWSTNPSSRKDNVDEADGHRNQDCIFKQALCFVLYHWWDGTFQNGDTFEFEADPDCTTIEMPVLFSQWEGDALAETINHVLSIVDGDTVFTGQTGDENTNYIFKNYVRALFNKAGFDLSHPEEIEVYSLPYHEDWGGVHCGANVQRVIPTSYVWWECAE